MVDDETQKPLVMFPVCILYLLFLRVLYPLQLFVKSCDELYICLSAQSQASLRHPRPPHYTHTSLSMNEEYKIKCLSTLMVNPFPPGPLKGITTT